MNLKNNQITVGELLDNPAARAVLQRRFPGVLTRPVGGAARTVTLEQLLAFTGGYLPKALVAETLRELERV